MTPNHLPIPAVAGDSSPAKKLKPWWKSHRFLYIAGSLVMMAIAVGIPWIRTQAIKVPSQSESQVTVGIYNSKPIKGFYGLPIAVTQDNGSVVIFSCAFPDPKWSYATCFAKQELHNGAQVKVFWSEQPAGFISGSVRRPSRIEKNNGEVLFSETEAVRSIEAASNGWLTAVWFIFLLEALIYYPLMRLLDRIEILENHQTTNSTQEK